MEVACTLLSTDVQGQVHGLSKGKGAGTETLLQRFSPLLQNIFPVVSGNLSGCI